MGNQDLVRDIEYFIQSVRSANFSPLLEIHKASIDDLDASKSLSKIKRAVRTMMAWLRLPETKRFAKVYVERALQALQFAKLESEYFWTMQACTLPKHT